MLCSWEHLKYHNEHPGAHFGTSLGGSWGPTGYHHVPARLHDSINQFYLQRSLHFVDVMRKMAGFLCHSRSLVGLNVKKIM